jgi:hypothetical protein
MVIHYIRRNGYIKFSIGWVGLVSQNLYMYMRQFLIWVKLKMEGKFPSDWERVPGEKVEYRKKLGSFEMSAVETEGFCEKCAEKGLGFSFKTVDSRGDYMGKSGAYWCPKCGEGMKPEAYEDFVQSELITPEM